MPREDGVATWRPNWDPLWQLALRAARSHWSILPAHGCTHDAAEARIRAYRALLDYADSSLLPVLPGEVHDPVGRADGRRSTPNYWLPLRCGLLREWPSRISPLPFPHCLLVELQGQSAARMIRWRSAHPPPSLPVPAH